MQIPTRPSLAYHRAFDLLGSRTACTSGPTAVLASGPFYAREVVRRLDGQVLLHVRDPGLDETQIRNATGPEVGLPRLRVTPSLADTTMAEPRALIWAEPEEDSWQITLEDIRRLGPPVILVMGTTWMRRLLPEWQNAAHPPAPSPLGSPGRVARALHKMGYTVHDTYGFHGPRSLLWGTASRLPAALGRRDLVDRCFAAMRRAYVVHGWQARWAPVWLVAASWAGNHG